MHRRPRIILNAGIQILAGLLLSAAFLMPGAMAAESVTSFTTAFVPGQRNGNILYDLNPQVERFDIWVPYNFNKTTAYGLIVYNSPEDACQIPEGWADVLTSRGFIFVAPQANGNSVATNRRAGLGVMAAMEMMRNYRIDSSRVYAAGFSGGARIASCLAFWHPEIFRGTIQSCGSNFPRAVSHHYATGQDVANYGLIDGNTPTDGNRARSSVKFVIITGPGDFRHGNLLDIYNDGFKQDGYQAKLIDVPSMGHEICGPSALGEALNFLK
jgi:poly(3-hydroxybutyrate) depolymerase